MNWIIDPNKRYTPPRMPLEGPTEPVDALERVVRTHPSGEDIKRISELLIEITRHCKENGKLLHKFRKNLEKFHDRLVDKNDTAATTETRSSE